MELNWFAVFMAALSSFVLGGLWYGPLFGKPWMQAAGVSDVQLRERNMPLVFGGSFTLALIAASSFAVFIGADVTPTIGAVYGAVAGICWVASSFGINYLFERKPLQLFLINGGYHATQFTLIGLILGALG